MEFVLQIEGHDVGVTIPKRKADRMQQMLMMMWKRDEEEREKEKFRDGSGETKNCNRGAQNPN